MPSRGAGAVKGSEAAAERAGEAVVPQQKPLLRDYIETILVCVIFVIFSRAFVFQQSKIPSGSMMDTLLIGDYIMVNRFVYAPHVSEFERRLLPLRSITRGDVIVFKQPNEPEVDFIKRVVGTPGDIVELRDGYLHVNGEPIDEPYLSDVYRSRDPKKNFGPIEVLPDQYFVLGDHRNQSADSRFWGQVPRALIKGRALLIWWSYDEEDSKIYMNLRERLSSWGHKIVHFFTRSRWGRCFNLIR
jgi:signal peptidase I